jgi:hypothetical protein
MDLFSMLAELEGNDHFHEARLLVLLNAFSGADGAGTVEGLTKLAKLDFLLRYPVFLERALLAKNLSIKNTPIATYERTSIESKMVRFKYGPWDHRYRRFLNLLVARKLIKVTMSGRTVMIGLTDTGREVASRLANDDAYSDTVARAATIHRHFNLRGTTLMKFIYDTFPEIVDLRMNEDIDQ